MGAGAAVEWLPHLCKKLPSGEERTAAVRLPINPAQLWIERMSASFAPHPFQCRSGMKFCNQFWDILAPPFFFLAVSKGGLSSFSPYRVPRHDCRVSFAFVTSFSAVKCVWSFVLSFLETGDGVSSFLSAAQGVVEVVDLEYLEQEFTAI